MVNTKTNKTDEFWLDLGRRVCNSRRIVKNIFFLKLEIDRKREANRFFYKMYEEFYTVNGILDSIVCGDREFDIQGRHVTEIFYNNDSTEELSEIGPYNIQYVICTLNEVIELLPSFNFNGCFENSEKKLKNACLKVLRLIDKAKLQPSKNDNFHIVVNFPQNQDNV